MRWVFWGALAAIGYAYVGYAAVLWLRRLSFRRPVQSASCLPSVSVVLIVRNEAAVLERKLKNLLNLNYPADRLEIIVLSDGSTDDTNRILSGFAGQARAHVILKGEARGKAAGLNDAMEAACGEVVVFTDARQQIEPDALRFLLENFADSQVGCASGELMMGDPTSGEATGGMGLYWKIEKKVRQMESESGSVVGATGALYAVRRSLLVQLPPETILDDVYIPMHVVRQGCRVVFDSRARVWDQCDLGNEREFSRKVRTLSGNYQLLRLAPWLLSKANPARFSFISHKLIRLFVPFALIALLAASLALSGPVYRAVLILQVIFYALSLWAWLLPRRGPAAGVANAAFTLAMLNTAAVVAFANFVTGRRVVWLR